MPRLPSNMLQGRLVSRLAGLILIGAGLAGAIVGGLLFWTSVQTQLGLDQAEADARAQAANLERQIERIRAALASDAFRTAALQSESDRDGLIRALRQQQVSNVLNVVVATGPVESADLGALPGNGFAALEMLLQARTSRDVPAQVHFAGTPDEYLAVAARLLPEDPASAVALTTFPVSVLANRVVLPESVDVMRLVQVAGGDGEIELDTFGGRWRGSTRGRSAAIEGSLFQLEWYRSAPIQPLSEIQIAGVLGAGALTVLLGFLIARRARRDADTAPGQEDAAAAPESEPPAAPAGPEPPQAEPGSERPSPSVSPESATAPAADGGVDDALAFDPDSPADEGDEIRAMLKSLVEGDGEEETADDAAPGPSAAAEAATGLDPAGDNGEFALPPASIFRAYDIRGVVGDTLSVDYADAIGRAIGSEARSLGLSHIAVARDGRLSGAELLAALSRGLVATGMEVVDVGAVPTPVLYYAAQEVAGGSGVMVTGSHNPPDYNGFKIVLGGETLSGDRITALHRRLEAGDVVQGRGEITEQRVAVRYVERIGTDIQLEKPLKVVADCGNGIAGAIAPRLLEAIGAEVIPLYAEVDGTFPNHHPDPGDPATLEDLKLCVRNFNADVGVAFDGDGDRLGVVAPDGEIIYPDRLMMLFARDVLSRNPGQPIIFDVKCSKLLADEIADAGGRPVMARTGHSFIKEQLKRERAPLAGEMSGHFFFGERWYGFDDGMYAAARLLEILAADTRATGQILGSLPNAVSTPELKVEMKEGETHPFVEAFKQAAEFPDAEINDIDGVRADFPDGFGLVRASNTTPVLIVRFEGNDTEALARIQQQFRDAMLSVNPALELPF